MPLPRVLALLLCLLLSGCGAAGARDKGGLVRPRVDAGALGLAHRGERYALLIGISHFEDPAWGNLRYAEKDAEDLARALRDPLRGGFRQVTVLNTPQATTRERVRAALRELEARAFREQDVVLVYVSSHGTLARDLRGELQRYLVTSDARLQQVADTALQTQELEEALERLGSRRRVLVLATCHSGSGKSLLPAQVRAELERLKGPLPQPLEESSRASLVLSASDWSEAAREDDALANDVYTHFLVEALDGTGDRNLDGAVSATEAHDYARRRTYQHTQGRQRPSAHIQEVGADPVLLAGTLSRPGQPELFSYGGRLEGFTLKVDGREAGELPGGVSVAAGERQVELLKGGVSLWQGRLQLKPGERRELEALLTADTRARPTAFLGAQALTTLGKSRQELLPGALLVGGSVWFQELLLERRLDLWVDAAAGQASHTLLLQPGGSVPVRQRTVMAGVALGPTWTLGPVGLSTGPRVAALWMERSFTLELYPERERYLTAWPGWMAAVSWRVSPRVVLMAQGQLLWAFVPVDGQARAVGLASAGLSGGYRF